MINNNNQVILEVKEVRKSFGENHIHKGVTFQLRRGESIGLLGGSGTGKSVLLRSLIGLEFIDGGEILFNGNRIDNLSEKELNIVRRSISYSFQSGALFDSLSVFDNIAYPLYEHTKMSFDEITAEVKRMLKLIDLEGRENLMPSDLSGGMQKRVGMARSMIMNPDIVLYDEPTAGLDPVNTRNVVNIIKKLKEAGNASIFVTHDIPSALELCDRLLILSAGKIVFNDTPEVFQKSEEPVVQNFKIEASKRSQNNGR